MKKMRKFNLFLLVLALFLAPWGCAGPPSPRVYVKDGKEYGKVRGAFRYRWWNYYERGLSYAEGEFYQEALADLKEGIQQRSKDQRMARTYGMHFIDYFPHRESGLIYYQLGNLKEAKEELELSLDHFLSAKARFYLDRVRKALIERDAREWAPPGLTLNFKTDEVWTREDPVILSGVAEDEQYVAAIAINGVPLFLDGSEKHIPFKELLVLSQGRHIIEVEAKNLLGMVEKRKVVLNVDREGPIITLEKIRLDQARPGDAATIFGSIYDEAGVSELSVNGKPIPIKEALEVPFTERIEIDAGYIELKARDRLGNQTAARIALSSVSTTRKPVLLACADPIAVNSVIAALFGPRDTRPPDIKLRGWTDTQTVFLEKVYIEGQISDENKIESLTINQKPILRRKGQRIFFSHLAELREGENTITIEARDEANNVASKKITVIRCVPKALQLEERLSLTVLPFEQKSTVSEASLFFQDNLIDSLVNQNRFRMVERDKLDMILQEQKLSRTKLIDRSTALRLGKLVAVHSIMTGSIIETRTGIEIVGRMIDTETSEILATEDVYDEIKDLPALKTLAEGMAIKFHREFPLLGGVVIKQKGKYIFTDLGQDKIKLQRRLIVYREEAIKHPVSGKILGADNEIIGHARVTQVLPEMSKAELMRGKPGAIKRLDKVITE